MDSTIQLLNNWATLATVKKKKALYLSVNVFSTKGLIGDGTAILHGHPSHAKFWPFAGQRE